MQQAQLRAPVPASTLPRLLARIAGATPMPPPQAPAARLGEWLDWPRAVALSRALDGPAAVDDDAGSDVDAATCARVREELVQSITAERGWPAADAGSDAAAAAVLRHCQSLQRAMQAATGRLRGQLRDRLARQSPLQARLAAVDAVLEGVLSPREHALLAPVPALLAAHCERLQRSDGATAQADGWYRPFREDARQVLLAELDLRFQPVDALVAALRPSSVDA
ncbi:DUF3348 family protein [Luteimonas yindakuii]|uniref:DUF3348 family protein n=1 Tax=Luteimonas yindakuii TaxID=2565782 RepID=A0A4Z1R6R1_9GAMM|nr:DUF3348 family protein [Luteimonas yindakuii]TKS55140.1 DUF3348 family protein [Luteimonas yindakuii]